MYFGMNVADGDHVVTSSLDLTLDGAEIIPYGRVGGALHIQAGTGNYASGMSMHDKSCFDLT